MSEEEEEIKDRFLDITKKLSILGRVEGYIKPSGLKVGFFESID